MKPRSFTITYKSIKNMINSQCRVSQGYLPNKGLEEPELHQFNCIWDTGATRTSITSNVAAKCGLKAVGKTKVYHAGGFDYANEYKANIILPNSVVMPFVPVTESILEGFDVLIGMDIINKGDFALTNHNGRSIVSFRLPSQGIIDFNKLKNEASTKKLNPKIGRNSPCPCGSGKKYKQCCGKQ